MELKVLGISSGLGVSLFPFKKWVIGNLETRSVFHTLGNEQWKLNFDNIPLYKKEIPKKLKPNVIISSPDCGSGSILRFSRNKQLGDHKDNKSLMLFFKSIIKYKPKFFLFENLDGLYKSFPKDNFKAILHKYYLVEHSASVKMWGNSQVNRKRLVIVGIRRDLPFKKLRKYFRLPDKSSNIKTFGDLIPQSSCLEQTGNVRELETDVISIHARKRMSIAEIRKEWRTRLKGKKRWFVEGGNFKTAPGVYRNLLNDYPATARRANRQFDHNGNMLTPRQLARIQGVPDRFQIYIDTNKLNYWINKARTCITKTPPYEIGLWFKKCLIKSKHIWQTNS